MKKALMVFFAVLLLVVSTASASFAYFTDNKTVTNSFSVGHVGISLVEYTDSGADPQTEDVTIKKIVPGQNYKVNPVITVAEDSVDSYLFVKVENNLAEIETTDEEATIEAQMKAKDWELLNDENNIYYYKELVKAGDKVTVFERFTVAGAAVDSEKLQASDGKKISITAYAVQAPGFDSAAAAWEAAVDADNITITS